MGSSSENVDSWLLLFLTYSPISNFCSEFLIQKIAKDQAHGSYLEAHAVIELRVLRLDSKHVSLSLSLTCPQISLEATAALVHAEGMTNVGGGRKSLL